MRARILLPLLVLLCHRAWSAALRRSRFPKPGLPEFQHEQGLSQSCLRRNSQTRSATFIAHAREWLRPAGRQVRVRLRPSGAAETLLMGDMPIVRLYYYVSRYLVKTGIRGFYPNERDDHRSRYMDLEPGWS